MDIELVVRHLYEILKHPKVGFVDFVPPSRAEDAGKFFVKNKDEIYVSIDFRKFDDKKTGLKRGADVAIYFQNGR